MVIIGPTEMLFIASNSQASVYVPTVIRTIICQGDGCSRFSHKQIRETCKFWGLWSIQELRLRFLLDKSFVMQNVNAGLFY